jgi:ABC-type branched-subunit amino acid transport system substrate-binding protein
MRKPFGAKVAIVAALLCAVPVLAACGGSDSESAAAGGGSAGGSGGGDPIKIFVYGPFEAKGFSLPGLKTGPEAAVKKVNDAGGINGRKLELLSCNDGNDPNQAAGCARQAVQDKAVAVVGGLTTFEAQITPILERAGIPVVGANPLTDFTSKAYFPLSGGGASSFFGLAKALVANPKCDKKVGVVIEDYAATEGAAALVQLGVVASGGTFTGTSKAPQGARDFAPAVAAAAAKAGCLGFFSGPQTAPQIVTAMKQSGKVTVIGSIDSAVAPALAVLGKDADGIVVTTNFLPSTDSSPAVQDFVKGATAIDPKFRADQLSTSGYAGVLVLQKALTGVGDINAKTVTEAVSKVKGYDTGLGPIADFTTTNPAASFSRLPLNTPMFELVSRNGMFYRANDKTIDISAIYQAASKAGK